MVRPAHFSLKEVVRKNILALEPYRCARDDYPGGDGTILLDANENALGSSLGSSANADDDFLEDLELNRYPSPTHIPIKDRLCKLRDIPFSDNVFLGVGSDEVIDLLIRMTCVPGKDSILICPPTYGMYGVCAKVNDVGVVKVPLDVNDGKFALQVDKINETLSNDSTIKLVFICSPGNPTSTLIPLDTIKQVLNHPKFKGMVVVDEAYIDFVAPEASAVKLYREERWDNLVIMQTFSKGFGLAGIRMGIAVAAAETIQILNNIKAPYSVSSPTAAIALRALSDEGIKGYRQKLQTLATSRDWLRQEIVKLPNVLGVIGASQGNFIMVKLGKDGKGDNDLAKRLYLSMAEENKLVVRFRGLEHGCEGCLRITIGSQEECVAVVDRFSRFLQNN